MGIRLKIKAIELIQKDLKVETTLTVSQIPTAHVYTVGVLIWGVLEAMGLEPHSQWRNFQIVS